MYSIGDRVAHPMHGAGTISEITQRRMAGQERSYYVLSLLCGGLQLLIPCESEEKVGLRPLATLPELENLLRVLPQLESDEQPNWNQRYRENMLRIKSGDLYEVARVIRGLSRREQRQQLSTGERRILFSARQILASEIALVKNISLEAAENLLHPLEA